MQSNTRVKMSKKLVDAFEVIFVSLKTVWNEVVLYDKKG